MFHELPATFRRDGLVQSKTGLSSYVCIFSRLLVVMLRPRCVAHEEPMFQTTRRRSLITNGCGSHIFLLVWPKKKNPEWLCSPQPTTCETSGLSWFLWFAGTRLTLIQVISALLGNCPPRRYSPVNVRVTVLQTVGVSDWLPTMLIFLVVIICRPPSVHLSPTGLAQPDGIVADHRLQ
jgi:hypothetical protein